MQNLDNYVSYMNNNSNANNMKWYLIGAVVLILVIVLVIVLNSKTNEKYIQSDITDTETCLGELAHHVCNPESKRIDDKHLLNVLEKMKCNEYGDELSLNIAKRIYDNLDNNMKVDTIPEEGDKDGPGKLSTFLNCRDQVKNVLQKVYNVYNEN